MPSSFFLRSTALAGVKIDVAGDALEEAADFGGLDVGVEMDLERLLVAPGLAFDLSLAIQDDAQERLAPHQLIDELIAGEESQVRSVHACSSLNLKGPPPHRLRLALTWRQYTALLCGQLARPTLTNLTSC